MKRALTILVLLLAVAPGHAEDLLLRASKVYTMTGPPLFALRTSFIARPRPLPDTFFQAWT